MRPQNSLALAVLILCALGFYAIVQRGTGVPMFLVAVAGFAGYLLYRRFNYRAATKKWLARASLNPVILAPPFADRWRVVSGGPDPRHNHHRGMSDQLYAYDFVREEGASFDQPILSPCAGMVAHVESRQPDAAPDARQSNRKRPFGNYVSIKIQRGYVILAHLKQGSVTVRVGDPIQAGVEIARSGNSGNSHGAHLHLHVQDQPSQSVDVANGIPVAFTDRLRSEPLLLEFDDRLG